MQGSGDLDECNGRVGDTPLHGQTYTYFLTDTFPYMPRCFRGTPDPSVPQQPGGPGDSGDTGDTGGPPDTGDTGGPPDTGDTGMPGPQSCSTIGSEAECTNGCPPDALGCICDDTPQGNFCAPTCDIADDCPSGPGGSTMACVDDVCRPQMGGGGPGPT